LHFNTSILILTPNLAVARQSTFPHFQSHFPPQQLLFVAHQLQLVTTNLTTHSFSVTTQKPSTNKNPVIQFFLSVNSIFAH